ncbi:hypothetical protein QAD02_004562 [Eretmocerus hayati]|uniref:Uncharacterized protein n=1 Tax=Eretmocerus hayati TaxID=131215 RepID=A0ACC2NPW1_9HYME|nr:hypothetical protein QAD02_004562 [Eretmocerus hayati]
MPNNPLLDVDIDESHKHKNFFYLVAFPRHLVIILHVMWTHLLMTCSCRWKEWILPQGHPTRKLLRTTNRRKGVAAKPPNGHAYGECRHPCRTGTQPDRPAYSRATLR